MGTKTWISVAALALAAAVFVSLREDHATPSPGAPSPGNEPTEPVPPKPAAGLSPAGSPHAAPTAPVTPVGPTPLPPLNGVKKAPQLAFHRNQPFTRVVGIERDARGREWYVHENGVRSTTYLDARGMVMGEVMMEAPVVPIDPGR